MNRRDLRIIALSFSLGALLCAVAFVLTAWRWHHGSDATNPYETEILAMCENYRERAIQEFHDAQQMVSSARAPVSGRLVDVANIRMMDAIHEHTDALSGIYFRCAEHQVQRWDHYLDIPNRNDQKLLEYLHLLTSRLPIRDTPPAPDPSGDI